MGDEAEAMEYYVNMWANVLEHEDTILLFGGDPATSFYIKVDGRYIEYRIRGGLVVNW